MDKRIEGAEFSMIHPSLDAYELWVRTHERLHPASCIWDDTTIKGEDTSEAHFASIIEAQERARALNRTFLYWIIHRDTQEWIGTAAIYDVTQGEYPMGWLGVHIFEPYQRNTHGTQAAKALIEHAFEDLELWRIEMFSNTEDDGTHSLAQKLGMSDEGTRRSRVRYNNSWHDAHIFCINRSEFTSHEETTSQAQAE